jgi:hypothetical protein
MNNAHMKVNDEYIGNQFVFCVMLMHESIYSKTLHIQIFYNSLTSWSSALLKLAVAHLVNLLVFYITHLVNLLVFYRT